MSVFETWGMRCPQCGDDSRIDVVASVNVRLTHDGTDADEAQGDCSHEWGDDSMATCNACDHVGTVKDFTVRDSVFVAPKPAPQELHCDKCGAVIPGEVVTSTGTGPEAGKVFFYCSTGCREAH